MAGKSGRMTANAWVIMISIWWVNVVFHMVMLYNDHQTWRFWIILMYIGLAVTYMYLYNKRKKRGDFGKRLQQKGR